MTAIDAGRAVLGDVLGVVHRALQQLFGRHDLFDQPQLRRFVGEKSPTAQQQVECDAPAGQPRQYPGDAVFRDQPTPGKRRRELRAGRGEPDITHQRQGETDADARSVDGRDDRFAKRGQMVAAAGLR